MPVGSSGLQCDIGRAGLEPVTPRLKVIEEFFADFHLF
jgi:hypothetical protein